jgi:hypothetical protein
VICFDLTGLTHSRRQMNRKCFHEGVRMSARISRGAYVWEGRSLWRRDPAHPFRELQMSAHYSVDTDAAPPYETIVVDTSDGVATITLSRPKSLNALNSQARTFRVQAFERLCESGSLSLLGRCSSMITTMLYQQRH